jgi:hypothetical protein
MMLLYDLTKSEKVKPNHHHFIAGTSNRGMMIQFQLFVHKDVCSIFVSTHLMKVIRAYSQPNQPDKAENAMRILQQMISLHESQSFFGSHHHPNPHCFRDALVAVLKACSHSKGLSYNKQRELAIVQRVQDMIKNGTFGVRSNEVTYGAYMGAIRNCMARGKERTRLLQETFETCSMEGFVDIFVLGQLRRSVSCAEFEDMVGRKIIDESTINATPPANITTTTSQTWETQDIPSYWRRNVVPKRM